MIGYAYGYEGLGLQAANPVYMIRAAYPQMINYFGIIASFLFSLSYSTVGVFAGNMSKTMSRKMMLGLACILWSCCTFAAGTIDSFLAFCLMRFMTGGFATCSNAPSFGILADYFPPERRSLANAIESSGYYVGAALASSSIVLIKNFGWRAMYQATGVFGMLCGLAVLLFVKEPKRGTFDKV
jgi:MFS family permease